MRLAALGEEPKPLPHDDRVDPEVELVDEVALEEPTEQSAAAVDLELAPGLSLEFAHRLLDVAVDDVGVLPRPVLQRAGGHVLGQHVDAVGDRIVPVVVWPVALEDLPGPAPEEERIRALEHRVQEGQAFLVVLMRPSAALEPIAAVLVGATGTLVHAVDG